MKDFKSAIIGHLDIVIAQNEDEFNDEKTHWNEILIHGDSEGLRSFAYLLLKLADLNQDESRTLPVGARVHEQLRPEFELSASSETVIVGRLDAKGTGEFYERYLPKSN